MLPYFVCKTIFTTVFLCYFDACYFHVCIVYIHIAFLPGCIMTHYYIFCVRHRFCLLYLIKPIEPIALFGKSFLKGLYANTQLDLNIFHSLFFSDVYLEVDKLKMFFHSSQLFKLSLTCKSLLVDSNCMLGGGKKSAFVSIYQTEQIIFYF